MNFPLFHLVRHGESFGNIRQQTRENDDELTPKGETQAVELSRNPAFLDIVARTDAFFCSPLRRALLTAIRAVESDEVAEVRRQAGKTGPVILQLDVGLRELNRDQEIGKRLYWRHRGSFLPELLRDFENSFDHARVQIRKPNIQDDDIWWDEDENQVCTTDYKEAHWRAYHTVERIRVQCEKNNWRHVTIFGHEGCFRSMTGVAKISNAEWLTCYVAPPVVQPCSTRCTRIPGSEAPYPTTKAVPFDVMNDLTTRDVRDLVVVLGCGDKREVTRRMTRGIDAMRCHGNSALVYVGNTAEFDNFLKMMEGQTVPPLNLTDDEKKRILGDQCSVVTECNIDHAMAIAAALRPDMMQLTLVTVSNAWHVPRARLSALYASSRTEFRKHIPKFIFEWVSHFMDPNDDETTDNHLQDGTILSRRAQDARYAHYWQEQYPYMGHELREVGNNMRIWHARNSARTTAELGDIKTKLINAIKNKEKLPPKEVRKKVNDMLGKALKEDKVMLALMPIGRTGSTPLMYCAAHNQPEIARDLVLIWGADLNYRNEVGKTWSSWESPEVHAAVKEARALIGR